MFWLFRTGTSQQCDPRNPRGDAESAGNINDGGLSVPTETGTGTGAVPLWHAASPPELAQFNAELPEILKSVAAVEKEVASIDRLIKNRLEQIHEMEESPTATKDMQQLDSVDKSKKDEKRKAPSKKVLASKGNAGESMNDGVQKNIF